MKPIVRTLAAIGAFAAGAAAADTPPGGGAGSSPGSQPLGMALIASYDTNGDGRIDQGELSVITDRGIRDYVLFFDADKDGTIDAMERRRAESTQAVDRLLTQFDRDGDQVLSRAELQRIAEQQLQQFVRLHDTDGDQALSRQELLGGAPMPAGGTGGSSGGSQPATEPSSDDMGARDSDPDEPALEGFGPSPDPRDGH